MSIRPDRRSNRRNEFQKDKLVAVLHGVVYTAGGETYVSEKVLRVLDRFNLVMPFLCQSVIAMG
jgi:hypothetical protein